MRVLCAASGGEGHLGPLLPFVDAAHATGDDVVLVVPPAQVDTARASGAEYRITAEPPADEVARVRRRLGSGDPDVRSHAAEVELFGRLNTDAALAVTDTTVAEFAPDLILREPCDYASAVVAVRYGIRTATVGISPGRADMNGLMLASRVVEGHAPGVTAFVTASTYLTRFPGTEDSGYPDTRRYSVGAPPVRIERHCRPLVWLTMGTVNTGFEQVRGTWSAALAALAQLDVDVVASTGRGGLPVTASENVEVVEWVQLDDVLGRADAVVCHGGSGTTLAALAAGVPIVTIPMLADQPTNAAMVEKLGAGITVAPPPGDTVRGLSDADVPRLREAVGRVLTDPRFRAAARASAAPSDTVASRLDQLRP